ncbi:hypothetical protein MNBD_PLANCTO03-1304 [hydrothermal vent metagenome]|uniref:MAM domain-containing protein n=1 Tax=hydrothermal vent metagenome TaxID=652676 RepID=A0A3B1DHE7_9ZZZZ
MMIGKYLKTTVCLALLAGTAVAMGGVERGVQPTQDLIRAYPGVRVYEDGVRDRIFYGVPMTRAATPQLAAERWLAAHGDVFGVGALSLTETWSGDVRDGKFWSLSYTQTLEGLPVELSPGRVLARANDDGTWSVVYAAGLFAAIPEGGFAPMMRTAQDAVNFIRGSEYGVLPKWSDAELVAYQVETADGFEAVRAWKFVGENPDLVKREKYTFFVDAATGGLLEARNEVHNIDVFGFAKGYATPGNFPDTGGNPPQLLPINDLRVQVSGGNNNHTDEMGFFSITHGGSSDVTITANFDTGLWCNINDSSGTAVQSVSGVATPGSEAYLEFNSSPNQYKTAQVNAFIHTGLIHNLIRDRSSWTGMDFRMTTNVNIASSCNAFFDGSSINFYRAGGSCPNMAYTTVVAHEYGHYIVARQGLSQGAFGEGYGDVCGEMLYDTGRVGEGFFGVGSVLRDNENTLRQYPCSGAIHSCGQVLGGVWWHTRLNLGATYGSAAGLEVVRQLFVDWTLITTGGSGSNSAHPGTVIEVLTLDDDDGNLDNGTPNYDDICAAFELHGIDCPDIVPLAFTYPGGIPDEANPSGGTAFEVVISGNAGFTPQPGTGVLHVDGGGGFVAYPMMETIDNNYTAEFPGGFACGDEIQFYVSAEATDGTQGQDPQDAPAEAYLAIAATSYAELANDNFETNTGWTVQNNNLQKGAWERGVPAVQGGTAPGQDFDGSGQCYITGNFLINSDVDGGPTRLISPDYDITGLTDPMVTFARWFYNQPADEDRMVIEVSGDFGASWVMVSEVAHSGKQWIEDGFAVREYLPAADQVRVRFSVADSPNDSDTEAGIDAFVMTDLVCDDECVADFNGDGIVNTQDVLLFLNAWSAGDMSADVNGDGEVNTQDVLFFLNLWNVGC